MKCNEPFHELMRDTVLRPVIEELRRSEAWGQEECGYCKPPVTRAIGVLVPPIAREGLPRMTEKIGESGSQRLGAWYVADYKKAEKKGDQAETYLCL